jgi:prepilin-type N-terminal cleavage/methylation domain-containing protein
MQNANSIHRDRHAATRRRGGFTLVELLIVVGLLLLLAVMTASAVNLSVNNDKVRGGARQVQSFLAGARDRAIYSKQPRGVRFLVDPTNNRTVSSMTFIAPTEPWTQGRIRLERQTAGDAFAIVVRGFDASSTGDFDYPTMWQDLSNRRLLYAGSRIRIPADNGNWYTVSSFVTDPGSGDPKLILSTHYSDAPNRNDPNDPLAAFLEGGPSTYQLELPPSVLPNQEPVLLPKGAVVHLDRCTTVRGTINNLEQTAAGSYARLRGDKLPSAWKHYPSSNSTETSGFDYTTQMDVMFSPRGVVIGPAAQNGIIHLYIGDQKDADRDRAYWSNPSSYPTSSAPEYGIWTDSSSNGYERGDKVILTIFTRTGAISTHSVFNSTTDADPFRFAETGEVAGK